MPNRWLWAIYLSLRAPIMLFLLPRVNNTVYAYDGTKGNLYWSKTLRPQAAGRQTPAMYPLPGVPIYRHQPQYGIIAPVIDSVKKRCIVPRYSGTTLCSTCSAVKYYYRRRNCRHRLKLPSSEAVRAMELWAAKYNLIRCVTTNGSRLAW